MTHVSIPFPCLSGHLNGLESLPEDIGNLSCRRLYLGRNKLSSLPASIVDMDLEELHLEKNPLTRESVPDRFYSLVDRGCQMKLFNSQDSVLIGMPHSGRWADFNTDVIRSWECGDCEICGACEEDVPCMHWACCGSKDAASTVCQPCQ